MIVQSNMGHDRASDENYVTVCVKRKQRETVIECIVVMANVSVGLKRKETGSVALVGFSFLSHPSAFLNTQML